MIITEVEAVCKNVWKDLKEHETKATSREELKMLSLTEEENKSRSKQRVCYICRNNFNNNEIYWEVRDLDHYKGNIEVLQILNAI